MTLNLSDAAWNFSANVYFDALYVLHARCDCMVIAFPGLFGIIFLSFAVQRNHTPNEDEARVQSHVNISRRFVSLCLASFSVHCDAANLCTKNINLFIILYIFLQPIHGLLISTRFWRYFYLSLFATSPAHLFMLENY